MKTFTRLILRFSWLLLIGFAFEVQTGHGQILPARTADNVREVLAQLGLDDAFFSRFASGSAISNEEKPALLKLLGRVVTFRRIDLERWARPAPVWINAESELNATPGEAYLLDGTATRVSLVPLTPDERSRFNLENVYLVESRLNDGTLAAIYTSVVPRSWNRDQVIKEPISAVGLYLKQLAGTEGRLVFVADRVAWKPETRLGKLGMDEGLFDAVQQRSAILASERECFYQLLAAAGRTKPHQLETEAAAQLQRIIQNYQGDGARSPRIARQLARAEAGRFDVVPLFNDPDKEVGRLVMFEGDARRAVEIRVDEEEIIRRFGISRYFEITFFTDDSQQNPLVGCVLNVPADMPLGEDIFARVRLAGFFFKSWAFPRRTHSSGSEQSAEAGREQQLAPLIIGRDVSLLTTVASWRDKVLNIAIVGGIVASLLAILWAAWKSSPPSNQTGSVQASPTPDFSHLDG